MFRQSLSKVFNAKVKEELILQQPTPEELLTESDIQHLPLPVRKYLIYTNAVGKSKIQNMRIEFDAKMICKQGAAPMLAKSVQYNFFGGFSRLFLMKANMMLVPFQALHIYANKQATFLVRVANLFNVVDIKGGELINFVSDDRSALQDDGTLRKARWSTPVRDYRDFDGRKIPTYGEAIWNYPEGDFTYGIFNLKGVSYNILNIN